MLRDAAAALEQAQQDDNLQASLPTMADLEQLEQRITNQCVVMHDFSLQAMILHATLLRLQAQARALGRSIDATSERLDHGIERILAHSTDDQLKIAVCAKFSNLRGVRTRIERSETAHKHLDRALTPDKQPSVLVPGKHSWPRWLRETADRLSGWCLRG